MKSQNQRALKEIDRKLRSAAIALLSAENNLQMIIDHTPMDPPESDGKLRGLATQPRGEDVER